MMEFTAKARFVRYSPFKLRPLVDVIRGKNVNAALGVLATCALQKASPIKKLIESAAANAKCLQSIESGDLKVHEIRVDHGPMLRYFKAGAMGRSNVYRKRYSHVSVVLKSTKEA